MTEPTGSHGRYFEDFSVGDVYRHPWGRTISETDNTWFTLLTHNTNQVHFNAQYAEASEFGRILVNSAFTIALLMGMSVVDVSQHAVANLGMDALRLTHPVFVGDTVWAESKILALRASSSRPHAGIVTAASRLLNQDGAVCVSYKRSVMVLRRDAAADKGLFPDAGVDFDA